MQFFLAQFSEKRWKPEYLYLETDYNTQTSTQKLFLFNSTVLQAVGGVELLESSASLEACWKVNEVKAHTQLKEEEIDRFSHGAKHLEAVPHI